MKILRILLVALGLIVVAIGGLIVWLRVSPPAPAVIPFFPDEVALELVADGFTSPVALEFPDDESGRLFVADQTGIIWIITPELQVLPEPFLDLRKQVIGLNSFYDERGLLGLAFHPKFSENGRLFVYYSAPLRSGAPEGWNHTSRLSEFIVSSADPNGADADSERVILEIDEPQLNHNGGQLAFGPDGYLYVGLGDGGAGHDHGAGHPAIGNGQEVETLLGSILRLDVDSQQPYAIPPDNPFVGRDGRDEIYAFGFRNPYRFSFDAAGGHELFVADVGQNQWEEIDIVSKGGNYGWNIREGRHCLRRTQSAQDDCPKTGLRGEPLVDPILEYGHDVGLSVIGGYVYRGNDLPQIRGHYIFGDWGLVGLQAHGRIFLGLQTGSGWQMQELKIGGDALSGLHLQGFGQDHDGELYILTKALGGPGGSTGKIFKLIPSIAGAD